MLELKQFVPNGRVSTGLLAWRGDCLVWAVGQRKYWSEKGGVTLIPLIGIGGGQELGESLTEAVRREAMEEATARIAIRNASGTLWVNADSGSVEYPDLTQALAGEPAPLLIWQMHLVLRHDDGSPRELDYITAAYDAELLDEPVAGAETPSLLLMAPELFLTLRERPRPLTELLREGATYAGVGLPNGSVIDLQGSALFLARHWDDLRRA